MLTDTLEFRLGEKLAMLLLLSLLLKAAPPPISRVRLFNNTHVPNAHLIAAASKVAEAAAASAAFSYATAAATVTVPRAWETDFHEDGGFRIWRRCAFNWCRTMCSMVGGARDYGNGDDCVRATMVSLASECLQP